MKEWRWQGPCWLTQLWPHWHDPTGAKQISAWWLCIDGVREWPGRAQICSGRLNKCQHPTGQQHYGPGRIVQPGGACYHHPTAFEQGGQPFSFRTSISKAWFTELLQQPRPEAYGRPRKDVELDADGQQQSPSRLGQSHLYWSP